VLKVFSVVGSWSVLVPTPAAATDVSITCTRYVLFIAATSPSSAFVMCMNHASPALPPTPHPLTPCIILPAPAAASAPFASLSLIVRAAALTRLHSHAPHATAQADDDGDVACGAACLVVGLHHDCLAATTLRITASGSGVAAQRVSSTVLPLPCAPPVCVTLHGEAAAPCDSAGGRHVACAVRARAGDCVVTWRAGSAVQAEAVAIEGGGVVDVMGLGAGFLCVCDGEVKLASLPADSIVEVQRRHGSALSGCTRASAAADDADDDVIDLTRLSFRRDTAAVHGDAGSLYLQASLPMATSGAARGAGGVLQSLMSISSGPSSPPSSPLPHSRPAPLSPSSAPQAHAVAVPSCSCARLVVVDCSGSGSGGSQRAHAVMAWDKCVVAPPVAACECRAPPSHLSLQHYAFSALDSRVQVRSTVSQLPSRWSQPATEPAPLCFACRSTQPPRRCFSPLPAQWQPAPPQTLCPSISAACWRRPES
jgi:hypothetical protein